MRDLVDVEDRGQILAKDIGYPVRSLKLLNVKDSSAKSYFTASAADFELRKRAATCAAPCVRSSI